MIYIITILYSVFLGSIFRNFFSPKYTNNPRSVSIQFLIQKEKITLVIGIFLLFLIDWISFLIVFQPQSKFNFNVQDFILTLIYIPTITFLTFALILSLDTTKEKYCLSLALYYIFSTLAELIWIILTVYKMENINSQEAATILVISCIYIFLKLGWGIFFIMRSLEKTNIDPTFITYLSCIFKPALLVFLFYNSNFANIIFIEPKL